MSSALFFASAVAAGFVMIALVVYSYVRPHPEHRPSVTALLGLLGFALVASPNWTSIRIRSDGLELSLLREMQARQLRALGELQGQELPEPSGGEAPAPARAPASAAPRPARPEPAPASVPPARSTDHAAARLPEGERLFEAFGRGELDLRKLSDAQLLALNARLDEQRKSRR